MGPDLYIVRGTCGEYSDRITWLVCWFDTEDAARAHAEMLKKKSEGLDSWEQEHRDVMECAGDPAWSSSYTGTNYYVDSVPAGPEQS